MIVEKHTKGPMRDMLVFLMALALSSLLMVARFAFGLPREAVHVGLSIMLLGSFLFSLIDMLRSKRPIAAAIVFVCTALYLVTAFCLWD